MANATKMHTVNECSVLPISHGTNLDVEPFSIDDPLPASLEDPPPLTCTASVSTTSHSKDMSALTDQLNAYNAMVRYEMQIVA